jgi:adenylate cyclase
MPTIAHYEVYTLESSGWVLHARFVSTEKDRALDEARSLDNHLGRATKVVRESYDTATELFSDQTIFLSPKAEEVRRQNLTRARQSPDGQRLNATAIGTGMRPNARMPDGLNAFAGAGARSGRPGLTRFGAPTHAKSASDLIARILFVVIGAMVFATSGTALIPIVISLLRNFGVILEGDALAKTLFAVFVVLFLASGFVLTLRLVPLQGVLGEPGASEPGRRVGGKGRGKRADGADGATDGAEGEAKSDSAGTDGSGTPSAAEAEAQKQAQAEAEAARAKEKQQQKEKERERRLEKEREKEEKERRRKKKKRDGEDDGEADDETDDEAKGGDDAASEEAPAEEKLSFAYQTARDVVMAFLSTYVSALRSIRPRLDTYNRFGINLYLAGVCDIVAQTNGLTYGEFERLLRETVEIMGTRAPQAASFVERLKSYLGEARYGEMVQCGREAMILQRTEGADPFANLGMVIEDWNTPKTQKVTGNTIAIVFTDIVGSTDMTSEYGDIKAQQILRAHNAAVRAALARFSGREIKHTGDGIMATFEHVPDSVWGMIDVFKAVQAHNQLQPEIPLRIRIGINAGEPISAENDYYGLAVTLAARICAQADMNQILVSQIVRDLCEGTELEFADRGAAQLKGIKQAQPIHEALWDGSPTVLAGEKDAAGEAADGAEADAGEQGGEPGPEASPPEQDPAATFDPDADGWVAPPPQSQAQSPAKSQSKSRPARTAGSDAVDSNLPDIPPPPAATTRDRKPDS